ncbi:DUF6542 domain-containing protein [Blastococcus sp. CCUG 61487]|uniref:DUF6542 domain-containing protein n=1 Tax=Blastococcus sp. CCUG 61487 TaxID=1840703 RepID=UPI0010BFAC82|nr:DUF6542 domain-containing protein [Blastococcus sp. CCUG 61487]TKJ21510.1 hypothetical protein A6V29_07430 [Blastococcus sp. CCUG 61487]
MTSASTADAWRQGGAYPDRSFPGTRMPREERAVGHDRGRPVRPAVPPRRSSDRIRPDDLRRQAPPRREPARPLRAGERLPSDPRAAGSRPPVPRPAAARAEARGATARGRYEAAPEAGSGLRGAVAVLGVFLVTLAGAGIDSFVGLGLGVITLGTLVGSATVATLAVRHRDLLSVVVAPPLVFIAVAALNIGLAPSASFNAPTVATLLIRGFPTMAIATGVTVVLALGRLLARR